MKKDPKDLQIPLVLIVVGLILSGALSFRAGSPALFSVLITLAVGTILMILAAFITASLIGVSFGEIGPAALKLAAIYIFPAAVGSLFPFSFILVFFIWLGLLIWLFELEVVQAVVFTVVLLAVNLLVGFALRSMLA